MSFTKTKIMLFLSLYLLGLPGCENLKLDFNFRLVSSFYPTYSKGNIVFDTRIEGLWSELEAGYSTEITRKDSTYIITYQDSEDSSSSVVEGYLFAIGDQTFLDITPLVQADEQNNDPFQSWLTIRTHLVFKVVFVEDSLITVGINQDWFEAFLESDSSSLAFVKREDSILLTSSSAKIQTFLAKHAMNPICFSDSAALVSMGRDLGELK